jgi:FlaA1/EpsC-like NDP-sugar epimerase
MEGMAPNVAKRIYIVGAGFSGSAIAREIARKGFYGRVVAFLDDDRTKIGTALDGAPVLGPIQAVAQILEANPADEAIIAIPSASGVALSRIYNVLKHAGFLTVRIVPNISQIIMGGPHLVQARDIHAEDFLSRKPVTIDLRRSLSYVRGKRVLVTGAGGSIGSELCRQLLEGGAERLYALGHGEYAIYELERDLRRLQEGGVGEKATIVPIVGDLQDAEFVDWILRRLRAEIVFHTAAHKHVPMTEANPVEAVRNNVFGTLNMVESSLAAGVKRFVLVSTDKAVRPLGIYAATKYLAEEIVLTARSNGHQFMVVRFGNVLGSRGSVVPLFRRQIQAGGPVEITHPEARRFFMTIPEAASLVLMAGGAGRHGMLYLLDMGEPIRIKDLAEQMIRFYGYEPGNDIELKYIGLRPGEKMHERLWEEAEQPVSTEYPKILRLQRTCYLNGRLAEVLRNLRPVCYLDPATPDLYRNRRALRRVLHEVIPTLPIPTDEPEY